MGVVTKFTHNWLPVFIFSVILLVLGLIFLNAKAAAAAAQPATQTNVIHVKVSPANTQALKSVLNKSKASKSQKLFKNSAITRDAARNQTAADKASTELDKYYEVAVGPGVNKAELVKQLKTVPGVEEAYVAPIPAPLPAIPSFTSQQTYTSVKTFGVGSNFAASWPGGKGASTCVYDIEYTWNMNHVDLSKTRLPGALKPFGTPADPFNNPYDDHGTAVLGVLSSDANTFGTTGMVPDARLAMVNSYNTDGYDPAGAIYHAASTMAPGCVLLLEQQTIAFSSDELVPIEWIPSVYDAIKYAVSKGITVIEPAGNGNQNLDDPKFGTSFPEGKPNSGAIMVGAGTHCTYDEPKLAREYYSTYGSRVNVQGSGGCVTTTGYGDLYGYARDEYYTSWFAGTSSASAVVAGAAASYSSAYTKLNGVAPTPAMVRTALVNTGTPQATGYTPGKIGPLPNLEKALLSTDKAAPKAPTSFTIVFNRYRQPLLRWAASTDNVKVAKYQVYRNGVAYATVAPGTLLYTDTKATKGVLYSYKVRALDASNNVSPFTVTKSVRP